MRALERRRRSEEGREDYDGAHHRFPRLQRVGDDVCALLAVPLGSWALCTASMRGARRLSSQQWIQIAVGEPTTSSYQWSRVVRAALVLSLSKLALALGKPATPQARRSDSYRACCAGDECSLLATPSFVGGLCTGCAVSHFHQALSGAQRRRSGRSQALNHRICPTCSRA